MTGAASSVGELVGRDTELTAMRAAFDVAAAGRPTVVLLVGEAGIGKTRLADEAALIARAAGTRVLRAEADAASREPMELWRGVYRAVGVVPVTDPTLRVEDRRWEHLEALSEALTSTAPVVVILEDLHWADAVAVWVLEHLPRALGDAPVAVVATSRDHEPDMPTLDGLQRVSRLIRLDGLDVDAVRLLAGAETAGRPPGGAAPVDAAGDGARPGQPRSGATDPLDPVALQARTGGNPLFVQELLRSPDGSGVIGEVLRHRLERFGPASREALATAALAGPGTPLSLLAMGSGCSTDVLTARLESPAREGVLDNVSATGVRFHHALLADAAAALFDPREVHNRLSAAWLSVGGIDGQAAAAVHALRAASGRDAVADAVERARGVAAALVADSQQAHAASLLWTAHEAGADCVDRRDLRAKVALDLAEILSWLGDLDPALVVFQDAAELARGSSDPLTRARAEIGANLWASGFVPDLARMRRLQDALDSLPPDELRLRTILLGRLTIVGGADAEATERVQAWSDEAVTTARSLGDPILIAETLLDRTKHATTPAALESSRAAADEAIRLAERAGRSDLSVAGHQRRAGLLLNQGDLGAANQSLSRAEVLAALLPSPWWRYSTLLQRTTLLALSGSRPAAAVAMHEAVQTGSGRIEPVVVLGCEALHQLMLFDIYGHADPRTEEIHRITMDMLANVPSPVFQVQKGYGAQLFGDEPSVQEVLHRFGSRPEQLLRSWTGDNLLRVFADIVARAGAATYAGPAYRALLPYAGLLNVGGGHSAGLPVDDVLGRLAALDGDLPSAVRHARDAVALARSIPAPPLLVHCLDHLADAVERAGVGDPHALRVEADALAVTCGVVRPGRDAPTARVSRLSSQPASMHRDGPSWILDSPLGSARLPDSNGPGQLARLLTTPFVEVAAVELAGHANAPIAADLGPGLDARAKSEYRRRLHELQSEVDDAETARDPVRAERAHIEMEALLRQLKRAVGLGGRDRPTGSDAERARINVVRSLGRTIAAIARQAPLLGAHLQSTVRTGRHCIYLPEPEAALSWTVRVAATSFTAPNGGLGSH